MMKTDIGGRACRGKPASGKLGPGGPAGRERRTIVRALDLSMFSGRGSPFAMWREQLGWTAVRVLLPWLAGAAGIALLLDRGALNGATAVGALLALLMLSAGLVLATNRGLRSAAREATARLGPNPERSANPHPLSPAAQALWPALLRLDRDWREHAELAETRLAAAEAAIAAIPDPLILIDRSRRIVRANAAWAELIGSVAEPRDLAATLRNPIVLAAADAVLAGDEVRAVEFAVSVPVARLLQARIARIEGPSLDGAAAVITLHDITAMKRADEMRADFIANAGHELKTPLSTLLGFIETLRGPARDDTAAHARFLGIMHEQAARMARLVDDLLSLSRIELNEHIAPMARVTLEPVLDSVTAALELRAGERGIHIDLKLPEDLPEVQGERDELAQVFQNLLDNAVKYARRDSTVTVTGGTAEAAVPAMLWVAVADQSDGIPSEHLPRLTERFYRVDNARSRELGGTGLGLAVVKHILNRHRGRLEIVSTLGQGSTFTVWLRAAM
jgi:two-component system, OmpR family, phosphate regulon sensor histidine kinase PhoR